MVCYEISGYNYSPVNEEYTYWHIVPAAVLCFYRMRVAEVEMVVDQVEGIMAAAIVEVVEVVEEGQISPGAEFYLSSR